LVEFPSRPIDARDIKKRMESAPKLRDEILRLVERYHAIAHAPKRFVPGETKIPYAGRVFDADELQRGVDSVLQFWLTAGPFAQEFEREMKSYFNAKAAYLVNSGSSANLLMVATLLSAQIEDGLRPGDEVITPAVTFPTTLTPLVQNGLIPVFVDCQPGRYDIDVEQIQAAIGPKTRAIFVPHTVGIPADLDVLPALANKHDLWFLEDGCDALGSTWDGKLCGTFGAMSSISFYPAHHMTMGEGGMVVVNDNGLRKTCLSVRDWGRDCWCDPGVSDTCGKRFGWQLGDLPFGYDHKYIYSNLGYNLKVSEMQAAIGCAQFRKLPQFIAARKKNAAFLMQRLAAFSEHIILPTVPAKADPSWFCFPLTLKPHIDRREFIKWLEDAKIETRLVFAGNVLKQPGFRDIPRRIHGKLTGTDTIMNQTLFLGVYPGLTNDMLEFVVERIGKFFKR
jgi:CDP-4-dehydro-6-deoxyglucose reductase, E1